MNIFMCMVIKNENSNECMLFVSGRTSKFCNLNRKNCRKFFPCVGVVFIMLSLILSFSDKRGRSRVFGCCFNLKQL